MARIPRYDWNINYNKMFSHHSLVLCVVIKSFSRKTELFSKENKKEGNKLQFYIYYKVMPKCLYSKSKVLDPTYTNFIEGWKFDFSFHRISRIWIIHSTNIWIDWIGSLNFLFKNHQKDVAITPKDDL